MVTEAPTTPAVVTCSRCAASTSATEKSRRSAILTRQAGESLVDLEVQAARVAARDADWEYDHDADEADVWLCPTCAARVAADRKDPCPRWCTDCGNYSFFGQGTLHRRNWLTDDGEWLAEVERHVDLDGTVAWTVARIGDIGEHFTTPEDLDRSLRLLGDIAAFLDEHGLVLDGGE